MHSSNPTRAVVVSPGTSISWGELWSAAHSLAQALPSGSAAVNLCECRGSFLTAMLALLIRGQTCLLPPSRVPAVVSEVVQAFPGGYCVDDAMVAAARTQGYIDAWPAVEIPPGRVVLIGYTSGSTGRPTPHPKTWSSFLASSTLNAGALRAVLADRGAVGAPWILATVPSQHMYGLETSVLLPMFSGIGIHGAHPLYPADIAVALDQLPAPRVLVTTPVHLRALLQSGVNLPALDVIVSATAPLPADIAREAECRYGTTVLEFFGSTETCVIATRRTACESAWQPYPGIELMPQDTGTRVSAPWLQDPVVLQDVLEIHADGTFLVVGRNADMIEVAGKRASLSDLTRRLMSVPGVSDAVVFQLDAGDPAAVRRLAALAVAAGMTEAAILANLARLMDPVFLPRPLVLVERLPRNEVGKLPRQQLLAAIRH